MTDPAQARDFFGKALKAYQEQRFDAAHKHCQKALKADPAFFDALHLHGIVLLNRQDWRAAAAALKRATELQPARAELHAQHALALQQAGRLDEARAAFERALALQPEQVPWLCQLGKVLVDQERFDEAYEKFEAARRLAPADPAVHYFLGQTEYCRGNHSAAVAFLETARRLDPANAFTGVVLGRAYTALNEQDKAIDAYRRAIDVDAHCIGAWLNLGNLLGDLGRADEALTTFEEGVRHNPDAMLLLCALAEDYERANRLDEAEAAVRRALTVARTDPHANLVAARIERRTGRHDAAMTRLRRLEKAAVPPARAIEIRFELGQLADHGGDTASAFEHFAAANRLQFDQTAGAEERRREYLREIDALRSRFTPEWVSTWQPIAAPSADAPVFLVGFPRSGTTLLDTMLAGHPRLAVMEELPTTLRLKECAETLPGGYPAALANCGAAEIARLRETYFAAARDSAPLQDGRRLVDKMPIAMVHAGLVHRVFPDAQFIFAVRHPCDVVLSCFMRHFEMNALGVNLCSLEHIVALYERAMGLWLTYAELLPLAVHRVRYEDVVADRGAALRALCEFLGLEWHDAMIDNVALARRRGKVNTPSYQQIAEPIYQRAKYRWQRYRRELSGIEDRLAPFIERFGYAATESTAPTAPFPGGRPLPG